MTDPSSRMLQLLSLLQTHRYWPGTELARRLDVSPRTLRRDVDRLRELGYPVDAQRGLAGGYQLQAGAAMPPLLLDDEEAVAIAVGLRSAAGGAIAGIEETSLRALSKVVQVMSPRLRRRVDALQTYTSPLTAGGPTVDAGALVTIAQACRDDERLRFDYVARQGERSTRTVEPMRLVPIGRRWYLLAFDLTRHDWRSFRVDRLEQPTATGARFRPREVPGGDPAAYVRSAINSVPGRYEIVVDVEAPAASVRAVVGHWGQVEETGEATSVLRMSIDSLDWPAMVLGSVGAEFTVRQPDELVEYLRSMGQRFVRSTG
jgi:predicted DNA-binding transcriptional regulator YafY